MSEAEKQFERIQTVKRVLRECPIGWVGNKIVTTKSTTDADIIKWLQDMDDVIGKL